MKHTFSANSYPHLTAFLRGYLHEDFQDSYGSVEGALDAYRSQAGLADSAVLDKEIAAFMHAAGSAPFAQVQKWLTHDLGSAWLPSDKKELLMLQHRLNSDDTKAGTSGTPHI